MGDLKTTQEERAEWRAILDAESADMGAAEVVTSLLVLSDLDTLLAENARLRAEVELPPDVAAELRRRAVGHPGGLAGVVAGLLAAAERRVDDV